MAVNPIIFASAVTNMEWFYRLATPLSASSAYFHPDIPFRIFMPDEVIAMTQKYSGKITHPCSSIKARMGIELSQEYHKVVIFDADMLITDTLDEVIHRHYTVAGARAFTDHGALQKFPSHFYGIADYERIVKDRQHYLNSGIIAATGQEFWLDWEKMNLELLPNVHNIDEGTFNLLAHGPYQDSLFILDPPEATHYYNTASSWGEGSWDSWKTITLKDNRLFICNVYGQEKKIKVLHEAGHGVPVDMPSDRMNYDRLFSPEVAEFLRRISQCNP